MTEVDAGLLACPFCGLALMERRNRPNPYAQCITEGCFAARGPVVNLDSAESVMAWNTRAPSPEGGVREALESYDTYPTNAWANLPQRARDLIETFRAAALRSSPPPIAGREAIARIVRCTVMGSTETASGVSGEYDAADAILRLTPSPSAEPVAWQKGIDLLREVQGYAQANADAARTEGDQDTWRAHWRNVTRAVDLLSMVAAQSPTTVSDASREALAINAFAESIEASMKVVKPNFVSLTFQTFGREWKTIDFTDAVRAVIAALSPSSDTTSVAGKSGGGA